MTLAETAQGDYLDDDVALSEGLGVRWESILLVKKFTDIRSLSWEQF